MMREHNVREAMLRRAMSALIDLSNSEIKSYKRNEDLYDPKVYRGAVNYWELMLSEATRTKEFMGSSRWHSVKIVMEEI